MSLVYIVKGAEGVIADRQADADRLYDFLRTYVTSRGHTAEVVPAKDPLNLDRAKYVFGHSQGTNTVLDTLAVRVPKGLKGVVLFDPSPDPPYCDIWNCLMMPRVAFISWMGSFKQWYATYYHLEFKLKDDHYFLKSFPKIEKRLDKIIDSSLRHDDVEDFPRERFSLWPFRWRNQ
ncbi:MAG: hypothetical protein ABIJ21_04405 [Nanoarchaeota archaeon]